MALIYQENPFTYGCNFFDCDDIGDFKPTVDVADASILSPSAPPPLKTRKRRRAQSCKNKEEMETQRMTHIAVERNRRRQMNDYLAVLRSLMPSSYAPRGDQASIVGGAINFVKELEQLVQFLEAKKLSYQLRRDAAGEVFSKFFNFPQYSTRAADEASGTDGGEVRRSIVADVEVSMVEGHASVKVLSERRPKQLLKLVAGLHSFRLPVLHVNVTSADQSVLYTFSVKVEDECRFSTVQEIATAVHDMMGLILEDSRTLS